MSPLSDLKITHIGTATAILKTSGTTFLTDPFFSPAPCAFPIGPVTLQNTITPALTLADLPPIDAILLSHEDHPDNLDELGRHLLDARHVFTTPAGAAALRPRPATLGLRPWETHTCVLGGTQWTIIGTPCKHLPGGEVTGFILHTPSWGETDGKKNVLWFSGDTVYLPELVRVGRDWCVKVALVNCGLATPEGMEEITMGGRDAGRLCKEIGAEVVVPIHFEGWGHFKQGREGLEKELIEEGVGERVVWLDPGKEVSLFRE